MKVLSVNAGSSTLKFRLYEMPEEKILTKGAFECIGTENGEYTIRVGDKKIHKEAQLDDHNDAVRILLEELVSNHIVTNLNEIEAVGHRIVHGGNKYSKSVEITRRVLKEIESLNMKIEKNLINSFLLPLTYHF